MSLEENHINIQRLGLGFRDNGKFIIESENNDSTAEFIGKKGRTTIVIKTPNERDESHNFMIRTHDCNILSISSAFNDINTSNLSIMDISEEKVCINRPLCVTQIIPQSNMDVVLGTSENQFKNIYTKEFAVDGFKFLNYRESLYNQNLNTLRLNEFAYVQPFNWYSLDNQDDKVYLDGDLVIINDLYLNGDILCNIDISEYKVNNININRYNIGTGLSVNKLTSPTPDNIIINDAWTPIEDNSSLFSKKTLVVNGNIYIGSNIYAQYPTTTYRYIDYSGTDYVYGNNAWSNIEEESRRGVYTEKTIYIDGDIITNGQIIRTFENNFDIVSPSLSTNVDIININDRIITDQYNTKIYNKETIDIEAKNIILKGILNVEGGLNVSGGANMLKEIYEHSAVYNSMDVMQKRYTYTGQMPISEGTKHELGYNITWITEATSMFIFELKGNIFMSDSIRKGLKKGLRIRSSFAISINPVNNNIDLPGLDEIYEFTSNVSDIGDNIISGLEIDVVRESSKHVKLLFKWQTSDVHNEVYNANINIEGFIPAILGRNMLFTPFHNVLEGATGIQSETSPYFANIDNEGTIIVDSNIRAGVVSKLFISGDDIGPALKVEQGTLNNKTSIAEFWDKNAGTEISSENDILCPVEHYGKPYGIRFGGGGVTGIGITKEDRTYLDSKESAQLNINSFNKDKNSLQINGYYGSALFDQGARLTVGSKYTYNDRNNVIDPAVKKYGLDIVGDMIVEGSITYANNGMLKSFFNMTTDIVETNNNIMIMYLSWITDSSGNLPYEVNNIYLNAFYQITSFNYINPTNDTAQEHNLNDSLQIIINPHNNGFDKPNKVREWSQVSITSSLFRKLEINVERQDYNSVKIELSSNARNLEIVKSRASLDLTVSGDQKLGQFNLQTYDDYFGIIHTIELRNVLESKYYIILGKYCFNIFDNYLLEDITLINIEYITSNTCNALIEYTSSNIQIEGVLEHREYSIQLNVFNRESNLIDSNVIYNIIELPEIKILNGECNIYINNLPSSNVFINLYDYYDISTLYDYSNMKDIIQFELYDNLTDKKIFNDYQIIINTDDIGSNYTILSYYKNFLSATQNYNLNLIINE